MARTRNLNLLVVLVLPVTLVSVVTALSTSSFPSSRCSTLSEYVEERGATVDGLTIQRCSDSERTMIATKDMTPGHVVLRIPIDLGITAQRSVTEYEAAADAKLAGEALGTSDSDLLAIWLLSKLDEEAKALPPSDPYLASLPTVNELSHIPMYWGESDLLLLTGSDVHNELASRKKRETAFFGRLSKASAAFARIAPTLDSWMWATCNVQARAFKISNPLLETAAPGTCIGELVEDGESETDEKDSEKMRTMVPALFPLADMVNHVSRSDGCACEFGIERESGDFLVRTLRDVVEDTELSISYGSISASGSLLNYGFVPESPTTDSDTEEGKNGDSVEGSDDCATIRLSLDIIRNHNMDEAHESDDDDTLQLKREIWSRDEGLYPDFDWEPMDRVVILGIGTAEAAVTVMSLLRVGVATKDELLELQYIDMDRQAQQDADSEDESQRSDRIAAMLARNPFRWRNEREALRTLENIIDSQLQQFAQDATGDSELDRSSSLTCNQENAIRAVQAEKNVLSHWWRVARMGGETLDGHRDSFDFGLHYAELFKNLLSQEHVKLDEE